MVLRWRRLRCCGRGKVASAAAGAGGARRGGGALRVVPPADLARVRVLGAELRLLADAVGELANGVVTALAVQPGASELDVLRWEAVSRVRGLARRAG